MSNLDEPIHILSESIPSYLRESAKFTIEMSPNEFTGKDGIIGFLPDNPDPYTFLSVQKSEKEKNDYNGTFYAEYEIILSNKI